MRVKAILLSATLLLSACDLFTSPDEPALSVELPAAVFSPGDPITVTLRNDSDSPWYFVGVCNDGLQRRENGRWVPAYAWECRLLARAGAVAAEPASDVDWLSYAPLEVPAGGTVTTTYTLPSDAELGEYRIGATFRSRADGTGIQEIRNSPRFNVFLSGATARQP